MDNIGGAEMVGLILAREFKAEIFTTNFDRQKIKLMGFEDVVINSIGSVPLNAPFRQQKALWLFRHFKLKENYDLVIIDGDWAMSGAVLNKPNLWYVHSPIREIWDLQKYTRQKLPWYQRNVFDLWAMVNRQLNRRYIKSVEQIACNSTTTQRRVKKYLARDAQVIHPPVDTKSYYSLKGEGFWLSVNRLIDHKRIEIQIEAFAKLPEEKLVIVGSYEQANHFQKYAKKILDHKPNNVQIISFVSRDELLNWYARCSGFITTAKEEDFGLTAIEAMASGKWVIAPNEGGYIETIIDQKTGFLIDSINAQKLVVAIKESKPMLEQCQNECINRAKQFDTSEFIKKISKLVKSYP